MVDAAKRPAGTADEPPAKRPHASWSWLWKQSTFSDIKIVLVPDPAAPAPARTADGVGNDQEGTAHNDGNGHGPVTKVEATASGASDAANQARNIPDILLELPAHKVVVASVSNYFRDRLVAWEQEQQSLLISASNITTSASVIKETCSSPKSLPLALPVCTLEEFILPDQLPAAEAVLQFMYTQELSKDISTVVLITVARLAERWDMPSCTQACLQALSALTPQQLPAALIGSIMADDLPKSVLDQPLYTPLLEACKQQLVELFGSVQAVIMSDALKASFCALPLSAVKLWARLDELKVDNENSVAILMTHWWLHNHPKASNNATKHQAGTATSPILIPQGAPPASASGTDTDALGDQRLLCGLVRLNQLSASFFTGVLHQLPWWAPPVDAFNMLCMARALHSSKGALLQQPIRDRLPAAWLAKPRVKDVAQVVKHQWIVSKDDFDLLHKEAGSGRTLRESPGLYWSGYVWHLCLSLNSQKDALWVGVRARSAVPSAYSVPSLMEAKFTIAVKEAASKDYTRKETLNFGDGAALQPANCNGTPRLLGVPAATAPRPSSQPISALFTDGKVHLQLTMEVMQ